MASKRSTIAPLPKLSLAISLAVLVPLLAYSAFQYAQSNRNEELLRSIYQRELKSILFSINQYCWDVYHSWATELIALVRTQEDTAASRRLHTVLTGFLRGKSSIEAVVIADRTGRQLLHEASTTRLSRTVRRELLEGLEAHQPQLKRSLRQANRGYIRPVAFPATSDKQQESWLVFPLPVDSTNVYLAALLVDEWQFVNNVVARKLNAMSGNQFLFSVIDARTGRMLFETEELEATQFERTDDLWILPNLHIRMKLRGATLGQIARSTTRRNLFYLGIVNSLIILGTVFLLRNVAQETRLAQMKTDFVANVSHELRTPLSLIRMYAEMLEMDRVRGEDKKRHYYRTIMNESARLTQLINNILDFARLEVKRKQYHFSPMSLNDVVLETVEMFRYQLQQQRFELELRLAEALPEICADSQAVTQALVNLMDNAIKFSRERRRLEIETGHKNGYAFVSIRDYGVGIPESEHKRIFEKFYRVESSLIPETKGSGLGLAIVKHIMEDHHGQIRIRSKPGEGSTFTLLFPTRLEGRSDAEDSCG